MNRVKVKTREQVKSVKVLDKAAVAGARMKNAYVRTREKAVRNREDRNDTPTSYAGDRAQEYARSMARNAARTARFGGKAIRQKRRAVFQRYKNGKEETPPVGYDSTTSKGAFYKDVDFGEDVPSPSRQNPMAQKQQYRQYFYRIKKALPQEHLEGPGVSPYAPTSNLITERGREFAKKQAAKRRETARRIKTKDVLSAAQPESPAHFSPETVRGRVVRAIRQRAKKGQGVSEWSPKVEKTFPGFPLKSGERAVQRAQKAEKLAAHVSRTSAKAAAVSAKKLAKASVAAVKGILAAAKTLAAAIAAGGWVAVLVVVVICLVGQLVCSGFGIFFSGEDSRTGQTVTTAVQEIEREFEDRLAEIQAGVDYDILDLSGSPAPWPDVLAVYAVKTTSDPDNGQEVVTMDDAKKELLRAVFWEMNSISSSVTVRTYEVSGTTTDENGNTVETTETETEVTLHITIFHRTAGEMADAYHFNNSQREQLDFLLLPENGGLWDAMLQ